jgi:hypothetical protein
MSLRRMLHQVDRLGLKLTWRHAEGHWSVCEHKVPFGTVGFGSTGTDALYDFLRRRGGR